MLGVWHSIQQCKANPCVYIPCKAAIALVKLSCRFGQISINIFRWGTKSPPVTFKKKILSAIFPKKLFYQTLFFWLACFSIKWGEIWIHGWGFF
jgi:hypothetical protein